MKDKVAKGEPFTLRGITYTYIQASSNRFIDCDKCIFWKKKQKQERRMLMDYL